MFHDKLYKLRKDHHLSQEELAQKLNVSRQCIHKWESGSVTPDRDKIIAISKLFHVSLDELLKKEASQMQKPNTFLIIVSVCAFLLLILCFILHAYYPGKSFTSAFPFDIYILFAILSFIILMISLFFIVRKRKK